MFCLTAVLRSDRKKRCHFFTEPKGAEVPLWFCGKGDYHLSIPLVAAWGEKELLGLFPTHG